jgi:ribosomal protein S18 acetylase RimI-like enzyme
MNPLQRGHVVAVTRVGPGQWHALEDDLVVGRGAATRRPDGRMFVSIDAWHGTGFDRLAVEMLAALPRPLHTVVDEADADLTGRWRRAGFTVRTREWEYAVPTDVDLATPAGVTVIGFGRADEARLSELDSAIRAELDGQDMPAEILGAAVLDPSKYAVAEEAGEYVGLLRIATLTRRPRIGRLAVLADRRRRGIGRALLGHTLSALHHVGKEAASAEVAESNVAATALFEGAGARRTGSSLELIRSS